MDTLRIVTGAAGLVGSALVEHLGVLPGRLLALDTYPGPTLAPVTVLDVRSRDLTELINRHAEGAARLELYHCAGTVPTLRSIHDTHLAVFRSTVEDNLVCAYAALHAVADVAGNRGVPVGAVLLSSVGATRAHRYHVAYDAAKAGVESLARAFTLEHGTYLSARCVALGPLAESRTTAEDGPLAEALLALMPRGRYPRLADLVQAIAAYAAPAFDDSAGHTLTLDAGLSVQLRPGTVERQPSS
ncbi:MAG: SDR family oxidoreductase [Actinobacteria bacterium]|nr:SDR family oxidoreductase [Actinomycetota bacterium]MBI3687748.1 SDR family oxidoreductase [Actinomycetota bacterium]